MTQKADRIAAADERLLLEDLLKIVEDFDVSEFNVLLNYVDSLKTKQNP